MVHYTLRLYELHYIMQTVSANKQNFCTVRSHILNPLSAPSKQVATQWAKSLKNLSVGVYF